MNFLEVVHPLLSDWFRSRFVSPTRVQSESVPLILRGKNVLISSPTGTGKTLAAFIGIINDLMTSEKEEGISCVYISPLRALNRDIERNLTVPLEEIYSASKKGDIDLPDITIGIRTSDTSNYQKSKMLKKPPDILITTPESFAIALSTEKFSKHLKNVKYVVIDEIHEICSSKRGVQLSISLERLEHMNARRLIRIGISATIAPVEEISAYLGGYEEGKKRPVKVVSATLKKDTDLDIVLPVENLLTATVDEIWQGTLEQVKELISHHGTTIVFTNTRRLTEKMVMDLRSRGLEEIEAHHGSLSKEHRLGVETDLKSGILKAVVCSTSLELGIDIGAVDLVVQVGSPMSIYRLVQRIGRAGHTLGAVCKGRIVPRSALDLLGSTAMVRAVRGDRLDGVRIPTNCLDVLAQGLLALSLQGPLTDKEAYRVFRRSYCYHKLTKKDFNRALDFLSGRKGSPPGTYAKVHHEMNTGTIIPRKGIRFIYFLNSGTIPPEVSYRVMDKTSKAFIGTLPQNFGQMLREWDVFLLAGQTLQVVSFKGQSILVRNAPGKMPTIPRWHSEVPSRTYELSREITGFLGSLDWNGEDMKIAAVAGISEAPALALSNILKAQQDLGGASPGRKALLMEGYIDPTGLKGLILHTFATRRINTTLGILLSENIGREHGIDVQAVVSDDHLLLTFGRMIPFKNVLDGIEIKDIKKKLQDSLGSTELFRQNFRLNAQRSLMILKRRGSRAPRNHYKLALRILDSLTEVELEENLAAKESRREVLDRSLDIPGTKQLLRDVKKGKVKIIIRNYSHEPTPLSWGVIQTGIWDSFSQGGRPRGALALVAAKRAPEFTLKQLKRYFSLKAKDTSLEGILQGIGPLTYQELLEKSELSEERMTRELYTSIESGLITTGFFKRGKTRVHYMLKRDWRAIKLREAGLRGAVFDESKVVSALVSRPFSPKELMLLHTPAPFVARGRYLELESLQRDRQVFRFRSSGLDAYVHASNLEVVTAALRGSHPTGDGSRVLSVMSENGDTAEALRKRAGYVLKVFNNVLNSLLEDLHLLCAKGRDGQNDIFIRNPVKEPMPREEALMLLVEGLVKGYGMQTVQSLITLTGELRIKNVVLELLKEKRINRGYLAREELVEVYFKDDLDPVSWGLHLLPPKDPVRVLDSLVPGREWSIFYQGEIVGSFQPVMSQDVVRVTDILLYPGFVMGLDKAGKRKLYKELFGAFRETFDALGGANVYVIETINGHDACSLDMKLSGFRPLGKHLVCGDVWENSYEAGDLLGLVLEKQRISYPISHPLDWIESAGYVGSEHVLLLRMDNRFYPFDPNNPRGRRVALHSLAELVKVHNLVKTYDLANSPVISNLEWAALIRSAKNYRPTRNQLSLLKHLSGDTSIEPGALQKRADMSRDRFKRDIQALKKGGLVLENGYRNLLLNDRRMDMTKETAFRELITKAFREFILFDLDNLYIHLGKKLPKRQLVTSLKELEMDGIITKGFLITDSPRLYWASTEQLPRAGDRMTQREFILTPKDPLAKYLAPFIKERFGRSSVFTVMRGPELIGAFRGRLTKSNLIISEVMDINLLDLKLLVQDFSDLNLLRSFRSEEAFKRYTRAKKLRKALYEDYFYTEAELDDYMEEYGSYFGDMEEGAYLEYRR